MSDCSNHTGGKKHKKRTYKKHKSVKKHGGSVELFKNFAVPALLTVTRTGPPRFNRSNKTKRRGRKNRTRK
jgi:hypothetical protein